MLSVLRDLGQGWGPLLNGHGHPKIKKVLDSGFAAHRKSPRNSALELRGGPICAERFGGKCPFATTKRSFSKPTEIANQDYYNLGLGFPVDTIPAQVYSTYTAALNGVDYVGEFVYPHPLTGSEP
jgi:hypothetical protein